MVSVSGPSPLALWLTAVSELLHSQWIPDLGPDQSPSLTK